MASYRVKVLHSAEQELVAVPFPFRRQINQRIMGLKTQPHRADARIVLGDLMLVEVSRWRLVYSIDYAALTVTLHAILPPVT